MFGNMESIKRNLRVGQVFRQRVDIRGSHVHRGDRQALFFSIDLRYLESFPSVRPSITAISLELSMFVTYSWNF